jgi:isocitrate/isopropylmalate dehydrogenase
MLLVTHYQRTPSPAARTPMPFCWVSRIDHGLEPALTLRIGAVGGPKWGVAKIRPEQGILRLRKELGLYANIRPSNFASESLLKHSPLKEDRARGVDIIVLRELIGGLCEELFKFAL